MGEKGETKSYRVVYYPNKYHPKEVYLIEKEVVDYLKSTKTSRSRNNGLVGLIQNDFRINKEITTWGRPKVILATLKKEN